MMSNPNKPVILVGYIGFFVVKKYERIALFCLLAAASLDSRDFIK